MPYTGANYQRGALPAPGEVAMNIRHYRRYLRRAVRSGPSTILRWEDAAGVVHEQRPPVNPRTNGWDSWKVIMCGARWAECLDDAGNVTSRYEAQS